MPHTSKIHLHCEGGRSLPHISFVRRSMPVTPRALHKSLASIRFGLRSIDAILATVICPENPLTRDTALANLHSREVFDRGNRVRHRLHEIHYEVCPDIMQEKSLGPPPREPRFQLALRNLPRTSDTRQNIICGCLPRSYKGDVVFTLRASHVSVSSSPIPSASAAFSAKSRHALPALISASLLPT